MLETPALFADLLLSRRLEKTEAQSNADFVEARARVFPDSGATWIKVAGTYAMFDGVHSPCTQTFGLGIFEPVTPEALDEIEDFFRTRQAPVHHEVSPLADPGTFTLLNQRGYQPFEFTSVMFRPLDRGAQPNPAVNQNIGVRLINHDEHELWAQTAAEGWSEYAEFADAMHELSLVTANRANGVSFIAELAGRPIATGALSICDGVALLAGASTIPSGRKQGAQLALLEGRLRYAAEQGCDLAMMCAAPGSSSQRNAERQGFRIAYTRIKWQLPQPAA
jgi:hypothetical protein